MRKLLFVVLCPVAVVALALLVGGAAGGNGNGHGNRGHGSFRSGQTGYHFLVFDAVSGTSDRMIIQGDGKLQREPGALSKSAHLRGPHRDRTGSLISHLSHRPHGSTMRSWLYEIDVNGRYWARTSDPQLVELLTPRRRSTTNDNEHCEVHLRVVVLCVELVDDAQVRLVRGRSR